MDHWGCYLHKLQKFLTVLCENIVQKGTNNLVDLTLFIGGRTKGIGWYWCETFHVGVEKNEKIFTQTSL